MENLSNILLIVFIYGSILIVILARIFFLHLDFDWFTSGAYAGIIALVIFILWFLLAYSPPLFFIVFILIIIVLILAYPDIKEFLEKRKRRF